MNKTTLKEFCDKLNELNDADYIIDSFVIEDCDGMKIRSKDILFEMSRSKDDFKYGLRIKLD